MVLNTCYHYDFVIVGGSIKHPEQGKILDLSPSFNKLANIDNASVKMYPTDGYGNPDLIRFIIKNEKPDALFFITDPRHYIWLFNMESEIRKKIPMIYLSIWDNFPTPYFNYPYYKSCDALLGISKQTHLMHQLVLGDEAKNKVLDYVPHGLNDKIFRPLDKNHPEVLEVKKQIFGNKSYEFVLLFNSRNMRRKQIPDTILAWKEFLAMNEDAKDKCALILHTSAVETHGTDLNKVISMLFGSKENANIYINEESYSQEQMNALYNLSDAQILLSSNEGWGLSLTEALLVGNPIIANATGGMQDQLGFYYGDKHFTPTPDIPTVSHLANELTHNKWSFPVYPKISSLQGSPPTPYIFDDRCDFSDAAYSINQVFYGLKELKQLKPQIRAWAQSMGFNGEVMGSRLINNIDKTIDNFAPRKPFEIIDTDSYKPKTLNHSL